MQLFGEHCPPRESRLVGAFPISHLEWIKQQQAGNAHPTDRLPKRLDMPVPIFIL